MVLSVKNLTKKYNEKIAVNNINVSFKTGINGLLGANGAGKTTLMKMLTTISNPTHGEILLDGNNITNNADEYRNILGFLPQDFNGYTDFTASEFMYYMGKLKNISDKDIKIKTETMLKLISLEDQINKKIKTFSGGMRRRLGIAQVFLNDPKIIIFDEPTAGLDPKERINFRNIISSIGEDRIIILSTHIVSDIENVASNIVVMKKGNILKAGSKEDIISDYDGVIWEMNLSESEVFSSKNFKNSSNYKTEVDGSITFHIVSNKKPHPKAIRTKAILEDVFLYHGSEETK
ncbi:MAG: ABC transporter ATP-binding protein [Clostridiales bacterium]